MTTLLILGAAASAQPSAFNFQGRLNDGTSPANGRYDLQFKLFDAVTGGNQIAGTVNRANLMLVNGVFSTPLDFGVSAFGTGERFLEIAVRPAGSPNAHVILGERQQLLAVPFAVNAQALGGIGPSDYFKRNTANTGNLTTTGNVHINGHINATGVVSSQHLLVVGNTTTDFGGFGLPKAMLRVQGQLAPATITHCYNGLTGQTAPPCGFALTEPLGLGEGVYRITFQFSVGGHFISVTPQYNGGSTVGPSRSFGANYVYLSDTAVEVFTSRLDDPELTRFSNFTLILF